MSTILVQHFEGMRQARIEYRTQWTVVEFACDCGTKCRADVEIISGMFAAPFYQHCSEDDGKYLPGPLLALWEEREGSWVLVEKFGA